MRYAVILLLSIATLVSCTSKNNETSEPERIALSFFKTYATDGPNMAVRKLLPTNKYISAQVADSVAIQLERLSKHLGEYHGYELIGEKSYGEAISYLAYTVKYSRQALRFTFEFYNPGNGWIIQNFRYDTEFLDLEETVKAYRLKENAD